jgi:predicted kinase
MLGVIGDPVSPSPVACLLITGTAGVGKSAVAKEVGELMRLDSTGFAVIDLDAIAKCTTDPPVPGFFESAIMIENLSAIWPNYKRYGVSRLILARAVASRSELDALRHAIPSSSWTVCRLTAPDAVVASRLSARESGIASPFLLRIAPGLADDLAAAGIDDFAIENSAERGLTNVAKEVLARWQERTVPI